MRKEKQSGPGYNQKLPHLHFKVSHHEDSMELERHLTSIAKRLIPEVCQVIRYDTSQFECLHIELCWWCPWKAEPDIAGVGVRRIFSSWVTIDFICIHHVGIYFAPGDISNPSVAVSTAVNRPTLRGDLSLKFASQRQFGDFFDSA